MTAIKIRPGDMFKMESGEIVRVHEITREECSAQVYSTLKSIWTDYYIYGYPRTMDAYLNEGEKVGSGVTGHQVGDLKKCLTQ